jgi:hypothetical protein
VGSESGGPGAEPAGGRGGSDSESGGRMGVLQIQ